jgi:hypothetical protein
MQMILAKYKQVITAAKRTVPLRIINARCQAIMEGLATFQGPFKDGISTARVIYCKREAKSTRKFVRRGITKRLKTVLSSFDLFVLSCSS